MINLAQKECSILVCSSDKYEDLWDPFFRLFFSKWKDCPFNVYLLTNNKQYNNSKVTTLTTGDDISWSLAFKGALKKINTQYVFVIMEDYLLIDNVNTEDFLSLLSYVKENKLGCMRLFPTPPPNNVVDRLKNIMLGEVTVGSDYRISLQAAIWNKEYLEKLINDKENAWQFEYFGTKRSNGIDGKIYSVCRSQDGKLIFNYYCTGVIQGYWIKEAVELCRKEGISIDLNKRKIEPIHIRLWRKHQNKLFFFPKLLIKKTFIYDFYRGR